MNTDRRNAPRRPVEILLNAFQDGLSNLSVATDVSETGLALRHAIDGRAPSRSNVDVEFVLPGSERVIAARAEVRREADGTIGLRFERLSPPDRLEIRAFVAA